MDDQYAYHNMSSKVIHSRTSRQTESTGEAKSVRGKIGTTYVMGDRIGRGAASDEFISRKQKGIKKHHMEERGKHLGKSGANAALQMDDTFSGPGYRPKNERNEGCI